MTNNRRATVIRTAGDPELAAAIACGIGEGHARHELQQTRAQLEQAQAARDIMKTGYDNCLRNEIARAQTVYRFDRPGPVRRAVIIAWTLLILLSTVLSQPKEEPLW